MCGVEQIILYIFKVNICTSFWLSQNTCSQFRDLIRITNIILHNEIYISSDSDLELFFFQNPNPFFLIWIWKKPGFLSWVRDVFCTTVLYRNHAKP